MVFSSGYCFLLLIFFSILNSLIFFLARSARKRTYRDLNSKVPDRWRPAKILSFYCSLPYLSVPFSEWRLLEIIWALCVNAHNNCQFYHTVKHCGTGSEQYEAWYTRWNFCLQLMYATFVCTIHYCTDDDATSHYLLLFPAKILHTFSIWCLLSMLRRTKLLSHCVWWSLHLQRNI